MALQKYNPAVSCDTVIVRFADVPTTCRLYTFCVEMGCDWEGCVLRVCGEVYICVCVCGWGWVVKCVKQKRTKRYIRLYNGYIRCSSIYNMYVVYKQAMYNIIVEGKSY